MLHVFKVLGGVHSEASPGVGFYCRMKGEAVSGEGIWVSVDVVGYVFAIELFGSEGGYGLECGESDGFCPESVMGFDCWGAISEAVGNVVLIVGMQCIDQVRNALDVEEGVVGTDADDVGGVVVGSSIDEALEDIVFGSAEYFDVELCANFFEDVIFGRVGYGQNYRSGKVGLYHARKQEMEHTVVVVKGDGHFIGKPSGSHPRLDDYCGVHFIG